MKIQFVPFVLLFAFLVAMGILMILDCDFWFERSIVLFFLSLNVFGLIGSIMAFFDKF